MRLRMLAACVVALATVWNVGCNQPTGGVAVVDLDEVARQVGASDEITQALKAREASLNNQLQSIKSNYVQQFEDRKALYGEQPTDEQSAQLVSISRQFNLNLVNAQRQAASHITSHRTKLIMQFREQVGPVAQEIAKGHNLSVVVPKNDGWLLSVDDSVNITDEVATSLKATWKPIVSTEVIHGGQPNVVATQPTNGPQQGSGVQPATHTEPLPPSN